MFNMIGRNESATQLWSQIFATMAKDENSAIVDPEHDDAEGERQLRSGLADAGWSPSVIDERVELHKAQVVSATITSPGVNPHVEYVFARLCDDVEAAMDRLRLDSYAHVARGVEPRVGPHAAMTNVIMTDESIITVGSFLFRFCGLVARAFTRTLLLNPAYWESSSYSEKAARDHLRANPALRAYWLRIFLSFAVTGTHVMVPFRPATKGELLLFEQVARAMEIFSIAHEYGHHHLNHGRRIDGDPKQEEFDADQFALKILYEVERKPLLFVNPYLSSGAGGAILLLALEALRGAGEVVTGARKRPSATHPEISARIARFDTVAVLKPIEFSALKGFRTASTRIMATVDAEITELLGNAPPDFLDQLRALTQHR